MVHHYLVKGRVQGVGFRWFVHREAAEIGLRGWVRNTEDGHVEVVAAGQPEDLVGAAIFLGLARLVDSDEMHLAIQLLFRRAKPAELIPLP